MSQSIRILFIEDDKSGRELGIYNLEKAGYKVDGAETGEIGLRKFSPGKYQIVITDLKMPGISGMEVLKEIYSLSPGTPIIVITAFGNVDLAVEAMKFGAFDFISKPFNKDHLLITIERALNNKELKDEIKNLKAKIGGVERKIIYKSKIMEKVINATDRFAQSDASVLISGESGTGKELIARRLHTKSKRSKGPFIAINCGAIPENLLESELFGHTKGSFTGANKNYKGKFSQAHNGTLFLDEIGELPLNLQSKILRALQEKEITAIGSDKVESINVRFISATNKNLFSLMEKGLFREDLFYRLNVVEIELPALRERREDILLLADYFVKVLSENRDISYDDKLKEYLSSYDWPGNIRELQNVCERLVLLSNDNILSIEDLPKKKKPTNSGTGVKSVNLNDKEFYTIFKEGFSLLDLERIVIENALQINNKNISKTAEFLSIPRHVLAYRMEKFGIGK